MGTAPLPILGHCSFPSVFFLCLPLFTSISTFNCLFFCVIWSSPPFPRVCLKRLQLYFKLKEAKLILNNLAICWSPQSKYLIIFLINSLGETNNYIYLLLDVWENFFKDSKKNYLIIFERNLVSINYFILLNDHFSICENANFWKSVWINYYSSGKFICFYMIFLLLISKIYWIF